MHRMGHSSIRAALIHQHATSEHDREIASGMDARIAKGRRVAQGWPITDEKINKEDESDSESSSDLP
jgi:hypothetical protein